MCRIDYIVDFTALISKLPPKNYYLIQVFYQGNFYQFQEYEDKIFTHSLFSENDQKNLIFYRYQDLGKLPQYFLGVKINDKTVNFKVNKLGEWTMNFIF